MKILTLVVHTEAQQAVLEKIRELQAISGFTFSHAEGHGTHIENDDFLAARDQVVGHAPRLRVDMLLDEASCAQVMGALKGTPALQGHAVYWVSPVDESGHL